LGSVRVGKESVKLNREKLAFAAVVVTDNVCNSRAAAKGSAASVLQVDHRLHALGQEFLEGFDQPDRHWPRQASATGTLGIMVMKNVNTTRPSWSGLLHADAPTVAVFELHIDSKVA
jgi:hypothetical protein